VEDNIEGRWSPIIVRLRLPVIVSIIVPALSVAVGQKVREVIPIFLILCQQFINLGEGGFSLMVVVGAEKCEQFLKFVA
jgi:hypothetical protein